MKDKVKPNDNLVIYFSSHGETVDDVGYWIPVEAHPDRDDEFVSTYDLKSRLDAINSFHTFVIADACFSGSLFLSYKDLSAAGYETKRSRWGLAASHSRERALDGTPGENSPFAAKLLKNLRENRENLGVQKLAAAVIEEVEAMTKKKQTPVFKPLDVKGDDSGQFVFRVKTSDEVFAWEATVRSNTAEAYDDYLERYPTGPHATKALEALKKLEKEALVWVDTQRRETLSAYREYLLDYPNGQYRAQARNRIDELRKKGTGTPPLMAEIPKISVSAQPALSTSPTGSMVLIPAGTFNMGDVMGDKEFNNETVHSVTLSDFLIGKHEVTFDEYDALCEATNRKKPKDEGWGRSQRPVINVSWEDAVAYCNWRSKQESLQEAYSISGSTVTAHWQANGYRLPTEAEWEYAAREGGKKVRFGNGKDIADPKEINFAASASYKKEYSVVGEYRKKTVPVGSLNSPNSLGLHDMSGNVWEWCWDWYGEYPSEAQTNPKGPSTGSFRVLRGGSWSNDPQGCRVAFRVSLTPGYRYYDIGFRLARTF